MKWHLLQNGKGTSTPYLQRWTSYQTNGNTASPANSLLLLSQPRSHRDATSMLKPNLRLDISSFVMPFQEFSTWNVYDRWLLHLIPRFPSMVPMSSHHGVGVSWKSYMSSVDGELAIGSLFQSVCLLSTPLLPTTATLPHLRAVFYITRTSAVYCALQSSAENKIA